jgi:hypothetical protein
MSHLKEEKVHSGDFEVEVNRYQLLRARLQKRLAHYSREPKDFNLWTDKKKHCHTSMVPIVLKDLQKAEREHIYRMKRLLNRH